MIRKYLNHKFFKMDCKSCNSHHFMLVAIIMSVIAGIAGAVYLGYKKLSPLYELDVIVERNRG
jgi:hypothetical protein